MKDFFRIMLQIVMITAYCIACVKLFGSQIDRIEGCCTMLVLDRIFNRN